VAIHASMSEKDTIRAYVEDRPTKRSSTWRRQHPSWSAQCDTTSGSALCREPLVGRTNPTNF
jgi:hypothetical protein